MPAFSQIELFLDGTYTVEEGKNLILKSRCICNYLERFLRKEKFQTTLSRINIFCSKETRQAKFNRSKAAPFLEVRINYDIPNILELDEFSLQHHLMKIIDSGLSSAMEYMPIPHELCINVLRRFEDGDFKNEWIQTQKVWKKGALRCDVLAELTTEKFSLQQLIYRDDVLVAKRRIAETKPREMLFYDYFGTLSLDATKTIVYKNNRKVLTAFNVEANEFYDNEPSNS